MGNSQKLQGKVALVTGGTTGIGLATARAYVNEGARVFITGRRKPELDAAVAELGPNAVGIQADSAKLTDLDRLYAEIKDKAGRLDVLFANAGGGEWSALGAITEEHYAATFDRNVKGVLFTVQKALPLLVDGASIILCGSTTSIQGTPALSVYSASKAAVRNFARTWILDLKERGIRVNTLSPAAILTPGLLRLAPSGDSSAFQSLVASQVPLGRLGQPAEIASIAVFLASSDSSFVNGVELFADGGMAQV